MQYYLFYDNLNRTFIVCLGSSLLNVCIDLLYRYYSNRNHIEYCGEITSIFYKRLSQSCCKLKFLNIQNGEWVN